MQQMVGECQTFFGDELRNRPRETAYLVRTYDGWTRANLQEDAVARALRRELKAIVERYYAGVDGRGWPQWLVDEPTKKAVEEKAVAEGRQEDALGWQRLFEGDLQSQRYSAYILPALALAGLDNEVRECASGLIRALEHVRHHGHFLRRDAPAWHVPDSVLALVDANVLDDSELLKESVAWALQFVGEDPETKGLCFEAQALAESKPKPATDATAILFAAMARTSARTRPEYGQISQYLVERLPKIPWGRELEPNLRSACRIVWTCSHSANAFEKVGPTYGELRTALCGNWRDWITSRSENKLRMLSLCECLYLLVAAQRQHAMER